MRWLMRTQPDSVFERIMEGYWRGEPRAVALFEEASRRMQKESPPVRRARRSDPAAIGVVIRTAQPRLRSR